MCLHSSSLKRVRKHAATLDSLIEWRFAGSRFKRLYKIVGFWISPGPLRKSIIIEEFWLSENWSRVLNALSASKLRHHLRCWGPVVDHSGCWILVLCVRWVLTSLRNAVSLLWLQTLGYYVYNLWLYASRLKSCHLPGAYLMTLFQEYVLRSNRLEHRLHLHVFVQLLGQFYVVSYLVSHWLYI